MPAKYFKCPDDETVEIEKCLSYRGCRMQERCASLRYLNTVAFDREWRGITASAAGNGPQLIYLTKTCDYTVDPLSRVFAVLGTGTHGKLHTHAPLNVLSEERLKGGTPDCLEMDEYNDGSFILYDDKTWGSYRVMRALGMTIEKHEEPILENGNPVLLKSGPNKGKPKTKTISEVVINPEKADLRAAELQLNSYRIDFESIDFPISQMFLEIPVRDGGLAIAKTRHIERNLYKIPVKRLPDKEVRDYYADLNADIEVALAMGYARKCDDWESWDGRRCQDFCDVAPFCQYAKDIAQGKEGTE